MKTELLSLGHAGCRIRVAVEHTPERLSAPLDDPLFGVSYEVEAHPFSGILESALLLDDLKKWRSQLTSFATPSVLRLGGDRAAELQLHVDDQVGGTPGRWAVEVRLVQSGDDPWPEIRYLIFEVEPFTTEALVLVTALITEHS